MRQVIARALGGIVREKRITDAQLPQQRQEWDRGFKKPAPSIDRPVQVQNNMTYLDEGGSIVRPHHSSSMTFHFHRFLFPTIEVQDELRYFALLILHERKR